MDVVGGPVNIQLTPDIFDESDVVKDPDNSFAFYESNIRRAISHIAENKM
jgi:hypothetical protein